MKDQSEEAEKRFKMKIKKRVLDFARTLDNKKMFSVKLSLKKVSKIILQSIYKPLFNQNINAISINRTMAVRNKSYYIM